MCLHCVGTQRVRGQVDIEALLESSSTASQRAAVQAHAVLHRHVPVLGGVRPPAYLRERFADPADLPVGLFPARQ